MNRLFKYLFEYFDKYDIIKLFKRVHQIVVLCRVTHGNSMLMFAKDSLISYYS